MNKFCKFTNNSSVKFTHISVLASKSIATESRACLSILWFVVDHAARVARDWSGATATTDGAVATRREQRVAVLRSVVSCETGPDAREVRTRSTWTFYHNHKFEQTLKDTYKIYVYKYNIYKVLTNVQIFVLLYVNKSPQQTKLNSQTSSHVHV